jgi:hypothetical protein
MRTYEVYLACLFCSMELVLGCVEADSPFAAKDQAALLWPDARYEEMHVRVKQQQVESIRSASIVEEVA